MRKPTWLVTKLIISAALFSALALPAQIETASAATPPQLSLNVLLIGSGPSDPTTVAWETALSSEGVAYTEATASGAIGSETVTLPTLSSSATQGNFNGVVFADAASEFAAGQLTALDTYESTFGVRQIDGYMFPDASVGVTDLLPGDLSSSTATVTAAGLVGLPQLKGTLPFDVGIYGYLATANTGSAFTPWITGTIGTTSGVLAGLYQHPLTDPQAGVSELSLFFDYNYSSLQWLLLAPGLINWVTNDTHLGLYRNYFGQDVDDNFIADNEWSSADQCTPAATDPTDINCSAAVLATPGSWPKDVQMSSADVDYVVAWEKANGITLNLAFNGVGACTAPSSADYSAAACTGSIVENGVTYTLPGDQTDASSPDDAALINELLADKADFNWVIHTWSHEYLGCLAFQPQAVTSIVPNATGGSFTSGNYSYEITAATAYGESEPSVPTTVGVATGGSVTLTWPDATNGVGSNGVAGPTLFQEELIHTGGTGFWGYNIYRTASGGSTYGLVAQVPENGTQATYTYTDTGASAPGAAPGSSDANPTATNPGIDCASGLAADGLGNWDPVNDPSGTTDDSIDTEIAFDQAWATANNLPNYSPSVVVTGEHSGIESPNMPAALASVGVTTFASDASRQPNQYSLTGTAGALTSTALSAPRYPSNIYYNASNWPDEINEYDTLYVAQGDSLGAAGPGEVGHCADTSATTCTSTPPTEATILASESRIMLSHILANNPRVGFAHQTNLISDSVGSVQQGYTLLSLLSDMLSQYNSWTNTPLIQMTDASDAQTLALQSAWSAALASGKVTATAANGIITVTNSTGAPLSVPVTAPIGTTSGAGAYGLSYGGALSQWTSLASGATFTLSTSGATTITSAAAATSTVGTPFSFSVTSAGPVPTLSESGALPTGLNFLDNANGTATIAGTPGAGTGGSFPITITAKSASNTVTQSFVLTNDQAPAITSASSASFTTGVSGTYGVTTTGYPTPTVSEVGALPTGVLFVAGAAGSGKATIAGIPAAGSLSSYPVTISASNGVGSTATLPFTLTVIASAAPKITSAATANFTLGTSGTFSVTTTGTPAATLSEIGTLPKGLNFTANANGTATIAGIPTVAGTTTLALTAANGALPNATQTLSIVVAQAPAFTSASSASFSAGRAFTFNVTASGVPLPTISESGTLPPGVTFVAGAAGSGKATISGTPTTASANSYTITLSAANSTATVTQTFTLAVSKAPAFTSATTATATVGSAFSFTVTTSGNPAATLTKIGNLPAGLTFTNNANGTATISGTPTAGGTALFIIEASSSAGLALQIFSLSVNQAPKFTSASTDSVTHAKAFNFQVSATGSPDVTFSVVGTLPSGVTFTNAGGGFGGIFGILFGIGNGDTATLSGTPKTAGTYSFTIVATNSAGTVSQSFTLKVS